MASRNNNGNGGGWIGALLAIAIVLFVVFWTLSSVGHVLGLTPTYSEAFESPDGWVAQHYRGVVAGYVLTVAAIATLATLLWLGVRTHPRTRHVLRRRARGCAAPKARPPCWCSPSSCYRSASGLRWSLRRSAATGPRRPPTFRTSSA